MRNYEMSERKRAQDNHVFAVQIAVAFCFLVACFAIWCIWLAKNAADVPAACGQDSVQLQQTQNNPAPAGTKQIE
jgi:hypothetical protein